MHMKSIQMGLLQISVTLYSIIIYFEGAFIIFSVTICAFVIFKAFIVLQLLVTRLVRILSSFRIHYVWSQVDSISFQ